MEWYDPKCFFVDNFSQYLLKFISERVEIAGQTNSDKWSLFFQKVVDWKKQFFISAEPVEIYGVNGWYVDLEFSRYRCLDYAMLQMEEYVAVLLMIELLISCDGDANEYKCIENTEFEDYFHIYYNLPAKEYAVLTNQQLCNELQHLYDSSFERFQHYIDWSGSENTKVIKTLKEQYPVFQGYLDFFRHNLKEGGKIIRLNSYERDESWYIVPTESAVFLISVREII